MDDFRGADSLTDFQKAERLISESVFQSYANGVSKDASLLDASRGASIPCRKCAIKHFGTAIAILKEIEDRPYDFADAIGELAAAETHLRGDDMFGGAEPIRKIRAYLAKEYVSCGDIRAAAVIALHALHLLKVRDYESVDLINASAAAEYGATNG